MRKKELDNLFEGFFDAAKLNLQQHGVLVPYVFLLAGRPEQPDVASIVEMRFKNEEEKALLAKRIEGLIQSTGAWGYVMVNETWILVKEDFPDGEIPRDRPPSQHPKRREAVLVALFAYDYHIGRAALFDRRGDTIAFTREIAMEPHMDFGGRFADMLPPMS